MLSDQEWVEKRLALLDPADPKPFDASRAYTKLRARDRRFRLVRRNWIWGTAVASLACLILVALPEKSVCCARTPDPEPAPAAFDAYKQSGATTAPLAVEIYTDFECPACAAFYRDTFPQLESQYVKTGKLKIVHRDFPLPQHPHAQLAARYANAAGELGQYELVFKRLFDTQNEWAANGNIDAALKPVLAPALLSRIRELVASDPKPAQSIALDQSKGMTDQLNQTPSLVIVTPDGQRHKLGGAVPFITLSAYLDQLLAIRHY